MYIFDPHQLKKSEQNQRRRERKRKIAAFFMPGIILHFAPQASNFSCMILSKDVAVKLHSKVKSN